MSKSMFSRAILSDLKCEKLVAEIVLNDEVYCLLDQEGRVNEMYISFWNGNDHKGRVLLNDFIAYLRASESDLAK
jgi:hypothetical protein